MNHSDTITASEIADWVYCPEAWRLAHAGYQSAKRTVRQPGTAHHTEKADAEIVASGFIALGRIPIVVALLAVLAA